VQETAIQRCVQEELCRGNQSKAATWLGISRGTLRLKLSSLQQQQQQQAQQQQPVVDNLS